MNLGDSEKQGLIFRLARPADIEQLVDIYFERFPNRAAEVFEGRRVFVRDYLFYYLSWDPYGNWVCADGEKIIGYLMAPVHYSPLKAMFQHGQIFRWIVHLMLGRYGFPLHVVKQFFDAGFSLNPHPEIQKRWGRPYMHLIAVRANCNRPGVGRGLIRTMLENHKRNGVTYSWGLVPLWTHRVVKFHISLGARVEAVLENGDTIVAYSTEDEPHY